MNLIESLPKYGMGIPISTNLQTLLTFIRNKLTTDGVFTTTNCYLGLYPQHLDSETADIFCVITPSRQVAEQPQLTGEGNYMLFFEDGEVIISIWTRLNLDAGDRGDAYLTDSQYGILPKVEQVYQSLNMYQPTVGSNQLVAEPIRLLSIDKFERVTEVPGWGKGQMTWSISWQAQISVPPIVP